MQRSVRIALGGGLTLAPGAECPATDAVHLPVPKSVLNRSAEKARRHREKLACKCLCQESRTALRREPQRKFLEKLAAGDFSIPLDPDKVKKVFHTK